MDWITSLKSQKSDNIKYNQMNHTVNAGVEMNSYYHLPWDVVLSFFSPMSQYLMFGATEGWTGVQKENIFYLGNHKFLFEYNNY